jgi:hypothetical protein
VIVRTDDRRGADPGRSVARLQSDRDPPRQHWGSMSRSSRARAGSRRNLAAAAVLSRRACPPEGRHTAGVMAASLRAARRRTGSGGAHAADARRCASGTRAAARLHRLALGACRRDRLGSRAGFSPGSLCSAPSGSALRARGRLRSRHPWRRARVTGALRAATATARDGRARAGNSRCSSRCR